MKTIKSLEALADSVGGFVERIKFKAHGQFQYGYAIVDADNNELLEAEPVHYSNGDRWKIHNRTTPGRIDMFYAKSLRSLENETTLKAGYTGYRFVGLTKGGNVLKHGAIV